MKPRPFLPVLVLALLLSGCTTAAATAEDADDDPARNAKPPNIIVFFADDMGYADLSCFGSTTCFTPNLDELADEGLRFTNFYSASPGCSPSRAALLTGCYPQRVGMPTVIGPGTDYGLNPDETTIPEVLRQRGYATAMVGKWHVGYGADHLLPLNHGFDEYLGLPYSNDMWPFHFGNHDVASSATPTGLTSHSSTAMKPSNSTRDKIH